jgi:tetratricopeptide (TPR) repeat protein
MPMLEMFVPYTMVTIIRFGQWDEMLKEPKPEANLKIKAAYWHFGRGMAYAGTKQIANAEGELKALQTVINGIPADTPLGNNVAINVLAVAERMLTGKIAFVKGDQKSALEILAKAVEAEDAVNYNEPSDWDIPVRELLGAALLMSGNNVEAEKVFRAEIARHQRNGRGLFGLAESLKRQGKTSSAQMVQREFELAWANADTKLTVAGLAGMKE